MRCLSFCRRATQAMNSAPAILLQPPASGTEPPLVAEALRVAAEHMAVGNNSPAARASRRFARVVQERAPPNATPLRVV